MSVKSNHGWCDYNVAGDCCELEPCSIHAHNPAVNESVSPSRTRGSLPASPGQSESEAAAVQLAPVLCPPDPVLYDKPCGACRKCNPNLATFALCIHEIVVKYI